MGKVTLLRIECSYLRKTRPPNKECGGETTEGGARRTLSRVPRGGRKRGLPPKHEPPPRFQDRPGGLPWGSLSLLRRPQGLLLPGEAGLRLNCVARRPAWSGACPAEGSPSEPPGASPSLPLPRPARRAPHPSRVPAAPPLPVEAASQVGLASTHGDPGPRAAATEGTSGPGRPAGAERQSEGRGPGRAGEVALPPRPVVPSRAR